jgi:hypothetical protein
MKKLLSKMEASAGGVRQWYYRGISIRKYLYINIL